MTLCQRVDMRRHTFDIPNMGYESVAIGPQGSSVQTSGGHNMGIGSGITLAALGAILAFAVQDNLSGVDLTMVGYILLAAGLVIAAAAAALANQKRQHTAVTSTTDPDGRQAVQETHSETTPTV